MSDLQFALLVTGMAIPTIALLIMLAAVHTRVDSLTAITRTLAEASRAQSDLLRTLTAILTEAAHRG
jgi:hypothetical protein